MDENGMDESKFRWAGIANGEEFTPEQKMEQRRGHDIPEDNQRDWSRHEGLGEIIPPGLLHAFWEAGLVDLCTFEDGEGGMMVTHEQAAYLKILREKGWAGL